jgi:CBS domain-containing protein
MFAVQCTIFLDVKYHKVEQDSMSIESIAVSNAMSRDVKTAKEGQTIKAVAKIMTDNNIGSVIIVKNADANRPVGIITERDIVRMAAADQVLTLQFSARDMMSEPVITIDATSSIKDALQQMELKNIRRLPVVDKEKKMVGIITDKDIFRVLLSSQSLVTSFCESFLVQYKPVYERLSEFMLREMPIPGANPNENS